MWIKSHLWISEQLKTQKSEILKFYQFFEVFWFRPIWGEEDYFSQI